MDFKEAIKQLAERILKHKDLVQTVVATKHSFVMPFIQTLDMAFTIQWKYNGRFKNEISNNTAQLLLPHLHALLNLRQRGLKI